MDDSEKYVSMAGWGIEEKLVPLIKQKENMSMESEESQWRMRSVGIFTLGILAKMSLHFWVL